MMRLLNRYHLFQQTLVTLVDVPSNDVTPSTCGSKSYLILISESTKLQTLSTETLIPVIESPIPSENLPVDDNIQPLSPCQLNTSVTSKVLEQNKVETGGFIQSRLSLAKTVPKKQQRQPSANNNQAIDRPTKTLTSAIKPATPMQSPVNNYTPLLNTDASESTSEKINQNKVTTINNSQSKLSSGNTVQKWQHQQKQQASANNTQAVIKPPTKTLTPATKLALTPAKLPANNYTLLLNTSASESSSEKLNQNEVGSPDSAQKERLLLVNTIINKMRQSSSANDNKKVVVVKNNVSSSTCYITKSSVSRPIQLMLQKIVPAIKPPAPSANVSIHHNTLPCSSGEVKQNKVENVVNPQKKLLLVQTVQKSPQQPSANKKQAIDVYSNNVVPKTPRVVSSSVPSKLKATVKKTSDPSSLTPRQTNTSVSKPSSEVMKKNNVKTTANLQSEMILSNAAPEKQQPQKAPSHLLKKTPVQSVDTNQSSKKSGPSMNLDKSKSKSIPDLSKRSINSKNSSNENILSENISNYASLLKNIVDPQTTIVQKQIDGNTVKMLVVMEDGEQRLISFNIPYEECTVNDLLEQAGILFNGATTVSLIRDPIFNINYIQFAWCDKCGRASMDFNHCYHCKKKIQNNPKTASYICPLAQKKATMVLIDKFYKSLLNKDINNDRTKLNLHTTIMCRTVKIGSYKYTPKDRIIINTSGLILSVPLLEDESNAVKIHVRYEDIGKVLIHFGESVIFFYTLMVVN